MTDVVGIELGADFARVVALDRWRSKPRSTIELAWDPARPADLVAALRESIGPARRVGLCVGLSFLHPKHVKLPPAPPAERRRILSLEPDRFFPVGDRPVVVALASDADFAFAADAALLDGWVRAFAAWAPVASVEPAPLCLARVLRRGRVVAVFSVPAGRGETGLVELDGDGFRSARRAAADAATSAARSVPAVGGVAGEYLCALGAARGGDSRPEGMLVSDQLAAGIRRRQLGRTVLAAALTTVAIGASLWALDFSRERVLRRIRAETASLAAEAKPAIDLVARLSEIERETAVVAELGGRRPDLLAVLASLSERLPPDAAVLSLRVAGDDWQIDGTAADAAAVLPLLAADDRIDDARFLSASARFQDGDVTRETFSIAFRVLAAS